jgi:hypothetical protein
MVMTLVDDLLPVFDVTVELAVVVEADARATWRALTSADLIDVGRRGRWSASLLRSVCCRRSSPTCCTEKPHPVHPSTSRSEIRRRCPRTEAPGCCWTSGLVRSSHSA